MISGDLIDVCIIGDDPRCLINGHDGMVAIDCETTGLSYWDDCIGIGIAWKNEIGDIKSCYLARQNSTQLSLFSIGMPKTDPRLVNDILQNCDTCWHSVAFDYRVLVKAIGAPVPRRPVEVTVLAMNAGFSDRLSLEMLYRQYVGPVSELVSSVKKKRAGLHKIDLDTQASYGRGDAQMTLELANVLLGINQMVAPDFVEEDIEFIRIVLWMINRGVPANREWLEAKLGEMNVRLAQIAAYNKTNALPDPGSDDKVAAWLFGGMKQTPMAMTPTGKRGKVDAETLQYYSNVPGVPGILEYRQCQKAIGSWLEPLLEMSKYDGRVRSILAPFGTRSFRMSSSEINLQGIPMKDRNRAFGDFHGAFSARISGEGVLMSLDLKQAEVRMAAIRSNERGLAMVLASKVDPYVATSIRLWNTETRRNDAKRAVLSSIYEIGAASYSMIYKVDQEEASEILNAFRTAYPGIKRASKKKERFASENGYIEAYDGRKRYFGPADELWKAFNQDVQTSVAELMQEAMRRVGKAFPEAMLLQIHDSLVVLAPEHELERKQMLEEIANMLVSSLPDSVQSHMSIKVPMLVDIEEWE